MTAFEVAFYLLQGFVLGAAGVCIYAAISAIIYLWKHPCENER